MLRKRAISWNDRLPGKPKMRPTLSLNPSYLPMVAFAPKNCIRSNAIAQHRGKEYRDGAFFHMAFIAFLLALQAPSEALPIRRA